jgi:hypothetical protein
MGSPCVDRDGLQAGGQHFISPMTTVCYPRRAGILLRAEYRLAGEAFRIIEVERVEFPDDVLARRRLLRPPLIPGPASLKLHEVQLR